MNLKIIKACIKHPLIAASLALALHHIAMALGPNFLWGHYWQLVAQAEITLNRLNPDLSPTTLLGIITGTALLTTAGDKWCIPLAEWLEKHHGEKIRTMAVKFKFLNRWEEEVKNRFFNQGKAEGIAEGIAEGRAEGKAEGQAIGIAQGIAQGQAETLDQLVQEGKLTPAERDEFIEKINQAPAELKAAKAEEENQILAMVEAAQHLSPEQRKTIQATLDPHQERSNPSRDDQT